jgi:hypothetical protein
LHSAIFRSESHPYLAFAMTPPPARRSLRRTVIVTILCLFLLPVAARAALFAFEDRPRSWREADWSSTGSLPPASAHPQARVLVLSGRTGGLKGAVAVHSWIVLKRAGAPRWTRYDVVGWGNPVRVNGWAPDGRWYGSPPHVVADVEGAEAEALIPKIEAAVRDYRYGRAGDYRMWPGPNSNTFVAAVLRAIPEVQAMLPPNAVGRDFRSEPYVGLSDSGTGIEANLYGLLGFKLGWVEGVEINVLGLVAGLDLRHPGIKLPGFGRIGLGADTALASHIRAVNAR